MKSARQATDDQDDMVRERRVAEVTMRQQWPEVLSDQEQAEKIPQQSHGESTYQSRRDQAWRIFDALRRSVSSDWRGLGERRCRIHRRAERAVERPSRACRQTLVELRVHVFDPRWRRSQRR